MSKPRAAVYIGHGTKQGHYTITISSRESLPKDAIEARLSEHLSRIAHAQVTTRHDNERHRDILQAGCVAVEKAYNPGTNSLTFFDVPQNMVLPLCCQDYTRSIDMSGLHDPTARFKLHQYGRERGVTVTPR